MNQDILEKKAILRQQMRALSLKIDSKQRAVDSQIVASILLGLVAREAETDPNLRVAIFRSFKDEIDLTPFENGLADLEIHYDLLNENNLPEKSVSIVVVPGAAFEINGKRLGRGKGYYDRLLSHYRADVKSVIAIGVGYDHQLVDDVPTECHDQSVDFLCMPSLGLRAC